MSALVPANKNDTRCDLGDKPSERKVVKIIFIRFRDFYETWLGLDRASLRLKSSIGECDIFPADSRKENMQCLSASVSQRQLKVKLDGIACLRAVIQRLGILHCHRLQLLVVPPSLCNILSNRIGDGI